MGLYGNLAGDFTKNARSKMFLSWQTYEGLQITVHSVIEATRFVLTSNSPLLTMELATVKRFES